MLQTLYDGSKSKFLFYIFKKRSGGAAITSVTLSLCINEAGVPVSNTQFKYGFYFINNYY